MINDDKDLKLKECPFCGRKAEIFHNNKTNLYTVECYDENEESCDMETRTSGFEKELDAIEAWNTRATPQQPSEPLKELDEKAILMVLDQCCPVSMDKMAKEMIAQILWNKFGQPSEKKALSVDSIKTILTKIMKKELVDIGEHFCFVCGEPMSEEKRGLLIDYIAQAIHSALPAQREVRYPDTAYVDKNDGKPGRIEKINYCLGWNHCIDEFKKLNS